jgi:hypothetical protein
MEANKMSSTKGLRRGQVLHVSKYGGYKCDMWAVVDDPAYGINDMKAIAGLLPPNLESDSTGMIDDGDTFRRVKAEDIPNYVCAALAKVTLLGEI